MNQLHIRCGSDLSESIFKAGFEGDFLEWADPVCQGPIVHPEDEGRYLQARSAFIAKSWDYPLDETRARLDR